MFLLTKVCRIFFKFAGEQSMRSKMTQLMTSFSLVSSIFTEKTYPDWSTFLRWHVCNYIYYTPYNFMISASQKRFNIGRAINYSKKKKMNK